MAMALTMATAMALPNVMEIEMPAVTKTATATSAQTIHECDWAIAGTGCIMPDLAPIKCQMDGCEARIHHLCQRKWEDKNLVVEPNSTDVNVLFMLIVRETGRM